MKHNYQPIWIMYCTYIILEIMNFKPYVFLSKNNTMSTNIDDFIACSILLNALFYFKWFFGDKFSVWKKFCVTSCYNQVWIDWTLIFCMQKSTLSKHLMQNFRENYMILMKDWKGQCDVNKYSFYREI